MHRTTSSASSILKHIGGLNFTTFSQGPSVLTQMLSSSFNLRRKAHAVKSFCRDWILEDCQRCTEVPLHHTRCCFCGRSLLLPVCDQLETHKQAHTSKKGRHKAVRWTHEPLWHTATLNQLIFELTKKMILFHLCEIRTSNIFVLKLELTGAFYSSSSSIFLYFKKSHSLKCK